MLWNIIQDGCPACNQMHPKHKGLQLCYLPSQLQDTFPCRPEPALGQLSSLCAQQMEKEGGELEHMRRSHEQEHMRAECCSPSTAVHSQVAFPHYPLAHWSNKTLNPRSCCRHSEERWDNGRRGQQGGGEEQDGWGGGSSVGSFSTDTSYSCVSVTVGAEEARAGGSGHEHMQEPGETRAGRGKSWGSLSCSPGKCWK